jgi:MFS family permease
MFYPPAGARAPQAVPWFLLFQAGNAVSFTIGMGAPLVLMTKYLGGSEAFVGVVLSLTSFMAFLQLFAARLCDRVGFRRVLTRGWTLRAYFLMLLAPLPLLRGVLSETVLVGLVVLLTLGFSAVRGFASGAWFPWLNHLIPSTMRGWFFGLDQTIFQFAALLAQVAAGMFLGDSPEGWRYTVVFLAAWLAGLVSVLFLRGIREDDAAQGLAAGGATNGALPSTLWSELREVLRHRPIVITTIYLSLQGLAVAAATGFLVVYLRDAHWSEDRILFLGALQTLGILLTSLVWGHLSDRVGSRPLIRLADLGVMTVFVAWTVSCLGALELTFPLAALLFFALGMILSAHAVASSRIMLASCPPQRVTLGVAFFTLCTSFARGGAPLIWGVVLTVARPSGEETMALTWAWLFGGSALTLLIAQWWLSRLVEPDAMRTHRLVIQMLWEYPGRVVSAFVAPRR